MAFNWKQGMEVASLIGYLKFSKCTWKVLALDLVSVGLTGE